MKDKDKIIEQLKGKLEKTHSEELRQPLIEKIKVLEGNKIIRK